MPRRANDCVKDARSFRPPEHIFDEFWREGELAVLFGASGSGKTALAVQIAEALARGEPIAALNMPSERQRVLYVDLVHTDQQFHLRRLGENGGAYRYSDNLHRDKPPSVESFAEWLREVITVRRYRVVIIDDLTALRSSRNSTRETLKLMRELRQMTIELGISMLLISPARKPRSGETMGESNLAGSQILCDAADSVFAIGRHPCSDEWLQLVQIRCRGRGKRWATDNAPCARLIRNDEGLLALSFDERFEPRVDRSTRHLICSVKALRSVGASHTLISRELKISRTRVGRLLTKWWPSMQEETDGLFRYYNLPRVQKKLFGEVIYVKKAALTDSESIEAAFTEVADNVVDETSQADDEPDDDIRFELDDMLDQIEADSEAPASGEVVESAAPEVRPPPIPKTQDEIFEGLGWERGTNRVGDPIWIAERDADGKPYITYARTKYRYTRWRHEDRSHHGNTVDGPMTWLW